MEFLIRFAQVHEAFRIPELQAVAELLQVPLTIVRYEASVGQPLYALRTTLKRLKSPFCIVQLPNADLAAELASRTILCKAVYDLWGVGANYEELHASVRERTKHRWAAFMQVSFRLSMDSFQGSLSNAKQHEIVESFSYLGFEGPIRMKGADEEFVVFEEYVKLVPEPHTIMFGRFIGHGARDLINTYTLKKRKYISTTSMDSELALIGANLVLAAPGKLVYDPFLGTGGLPLACSHFGAMAIGSDIDARTVRGKDGLTILTSYDQYDLRPMFLDSFIGDLTHSPLRKTDAGWLDAIVCDPPYGVREGLKVLGSSNGQGKPVVMIDGVPAHLKDDYFPPKQPYSFEAMLGDILSFAAQMLVDDGRLSFWMPTANDEDQEIAVPAHPALELMSCCVQPFNKWSRRLLTYRLLPGMRHAELEVPISQLRGTADELNNFRKRYFQGFRKPGEDSTAAS